MAGQRGFFDVDERLTALSWAGDPLERLASVVDFEVFQDELERALLRSDRVKGGRPPYDAVLMFRLLVLQTLCKRDLMTAVSAGRAPISRGGAHRGVGPDDRRCGR